MSDSQQFSQEEVRELRTLLEIEKIRTLRMQYSHFMDSRQLPALVGLFADDALCEFGPYGNWSGIDAIAAGFNIEFKDMLD